MARIDELHKAIARGGTTTSCCAGVAVDVRIEREPRAVGNYDHLRVVCVADDEVKHNSRRLVHYLECKCSRVWCTRKRCRHIQSLHGEPVKVAISAPHGGLSAPRANVHERVVDVKFPATEQLVVHLTRDVCDRA